MWINLFDRYEYGYQNPHKNCSICLNFHQTQPKEKIIHHEIPGKPWEVPGADMFALHIKNYPCIVNYHSKFLVIKKTEDLSVDSLNTGMQTYFLEYILPKKIMSDAGGNFISDEFKTFCKNLNLQQVVPSSHHHQNNRQVQACIKFIQWTPKNALTLNLTYT